MKHIRLLFGTFVVITAFLAASPASAAGSCDLPGLAHQKKDRATVQRLEEAWSRAFLQGDTALMECLLLPEYTEITRSGALKYFRDELEMAARNRGKNLAIPPLPVAEVLLEGEVAVAFGKSEVPGAGGEAHPRRFADFFVWRNGRWRAFFSQQTPIETP